jgi:hypothetical protein
MQKFQQKNIFFSYFVLILLSNLKKKFTRLKITFLMCLFLSEKLNFFKQCVFTVVLGDVPFIRENNQSNLRPMVEWAGRISME